MEPVRSNVVTQLVKELQKKSDGKFPEGKLNKSDEGELCVGIVAEDKCVKMVFPKSVEWIAFTPDQTVELALIMIRRAKEIGITKSFTLTI